LFFPSFLWLFQKYCLPLTVVEGTSVRKCQNKFCIVLAFSYLWLRRRYLRIPEQSSPTRSLSTIKIKKLRVFILYCARFFVPLASPKVLTLKKIQIIFGFLFTYSYLWLRRRYLRLTIKIKKLRVLFCIVLAFSYLCNISFMWP